MAKIKGLLIDLDGTIYNDNIPIPGALDAINWFRTRNIPFRFVTNTTMKSRDTLKKKLAKIGIVAARGEIFSAAYAGAMYVRSVPDATCFLLLLEDAKKEYESCERQAEKVDYIVVGDLGEHADFNQLNQAFRYLLDGAKLIALQKNRYWLTDGGYKMDAGAFVAMLEYAAGVESILIGKPAPAFFKMGLKDLGLKAEHVVMIGDDIESDIGGAQKMGMQTILVKTGKFRKEEVNKSGIKPDYTVDSICDLIKDDYYQLFK